MKGLQNHLQNNCLIRLPAELKALQKSSKASKAEIWRGQKLSPKSFGLAAACGSGHQGGHQGTPRVGRAAPPRLVCLLSSQVHTSVVLQTHVSPRTLPGTALDCATRTACLSKHVQKGTRPSREHIPLS